MENIHNSAATLEQHTQYLKDPTRPEAKPYSSKQVEANEAHKQRVTLYHKTLNADVLGRKVFHIDEVEQAKKDGWVDTPYIHPRHPNKVVEEAAVTPTLEALRSEAKTMGITVDQRWGEKRLKAEMLKHG